MLARPLSMIRTLLRLLGIRAASRGVFGPRVARASRWVPVTTGPLGVFLPLWSNRKEVASLYQRHVMPRLGA